MNNRPIAEPRIGTLMAPASNLVWLDLRDPKSAREKIAESPQSVFPVIDGRPEALVGIVEAKDLLAAGYLGAPLDLRALSKPPLLVPEVAPVSKMLELYVRKHESFALVTDKQNNVVGLVTLSSVVTASFEGADPGTARGHDPWIVQRKDGSWLVDGMLPVAELNAFFESIPASESPRRFQTVAGLVLDFLGRIPKVADTLDLGAFSVEVVDIDGWRIDKVLVTRTRPR